MVVQLPILVHPQSVAWISKEMGMLEGLIFFFHNTISDLNSTMMDGQLSQTLSEFLWFYSESRWEELGWKA